MWNDFPKLLKYVKIDFSSYCFAILGSDYTNFNFLIEAQSILIYLFLEIYFTWNNFLVVRGAFDFWFSMSHLYLENNLFVLYSQLVGSRRKE